MLVVRLSELIKENNSSISELSENIGISRTALTQLANNESKMVRFSTLDKISDYFNLEYPSELFMDITAGKVVFTPHKSNNDINFVCECDISTESIRDSNPIVSSFTISFSLTQFSDELWQLKGNLPGNIKNDENILKIFDRIPPKIVDQRIDSIFNLFWNTNSVVPTFSDEKHSGIFSDDVLKKYISCPKKIIFTISDIESFDRIVNFYSYEFISEIKKIDLFNTISNDGIRSEFNNKSNDLFFVVAPYALEN